jgi:lipid-A-disaccharide synthase
MKYYIIAGEASGDLHGGNLMSSIQNIDNQAVFRFWGGDAMENIGGPAVKHVRDLSFMGFWEVLTNLKTILDNIKFCKKDIAAFGPDVLILIDFPGFNLRIAEWAKTKGYKVVYYIVPQVWAWHTSRVHLLKKYTDQLIAILPFEEAFYKKHGCAVSYVGHPLLDEISKTNPANTVLPRFDLALLPGSRKQEIRHMLPVYLKAAEKSGLHCAIAASKHIPESYYMNIIQKAGIQNAKIDIYYNNMYNILKNSDFAFVTSGTATLETALWKVPQVVAYKGNTLSYVIAKQLIKLPYISLVNLILNKPLVTELIQDKMTVENLTASYKEAKQNLSEILEGYHDLEHKLGEKGASDRAARIITNVLSENKRV